MILILYWKYPDSRLKKSLNDTVLSCLSPRSSLTMKTGACIVSAISASDGSNLGNIFSKRINQGSFVQDMTNDIL